jgi:hypothetical protein
MENDPLICLVGLATIPFVTADQPKPANTLQAFTITQIHHPHTLEMNRISMDLLHQ